MFLIVNLIILHFILLREKKYNSHLYINLRLLKFRGPETMSYPAVFIDLSRKMFILIYRKSDKLSILLFLIIIFAHFK